MLSFPHFFIVSHLPLAFLPKIGFLDPAVENEWRSEHGDTTDYGGQDGRLWRSVEMRARDTVGDESTRHGWRRRRSTMEEKRGAEDARLWRSVEMRARDTAGDESTRHSWR